MSLYRPTDRPLLLMLNALLIVRHLAIGAGDGTLFFYVSRSLASDEQ